jgi:co-chaperonin GroES (HSP10)
MDKPTIDWEPQFDYLILLPTRLPSQTEAGLVLPESATTKANAGVVIKANEQYKDLIGKEVFFPVNNEYVVDDSDTNTRYYIVRAEHVIMHRTPRKQAAFLKVEGRDV